MIAWPTITTKAYWQSRFSFFFAYTPKYNIKISNQIGNSTTDLTCIIIKTRSLHRNRSKATQSSRTEFTSTAIVAAPFPYQHKPLSTSVNRKEAHRICCLQTDQQHSTVTLWKLAWWIESKQISNSNQRAHSTLSTCCTHTHTERERKIEKQRTARRYAHRTVIGIMTVQSTFFSTDSSKFSFFAYCFRSLLLRFGLYFHTIFLYSVKVEYFCNI